MDGRTEDVAGRPATVVEALLFAPIGFVDTAVRSAPRRYKQFRSDLTAARFLGEMAVTRGVAELRTRRAAADTPSAPATGVAPRAERVPVTESVPESMTDAEPPESEPATVPTPTVESAESGPVPQVADLAIADYDAVPAIDVVAQLEHLDAEERALLERYERAHRARRTVLGKLAQLAVAS